MQYDNQWSNYLKAYLDTAIANKEITVYMRAQTDIKTGKAVGAETMIRWNFKHKTYLYPGKFIPYLERDGSIGKIEDMVLREVCAFLAGTKSDLPVTVGLSVSRLNSDLVRHLTDIADKHGISRSLISFELTASMPVENSEQLELVINELKAAGFKIADPNGIYSYGEPVTIEEFEL
jgi:EAL domain-containing protein (putative c-di-GMP-specific phosphodiesterase class I)